ncbi:hypothetical protein DL96DRAFT_884529 [Flagelloscypha sp. PMI_526]|nr:hypothetical protein DL96DRAFT_884529 [Flagelloscypha sp. PMI_526]
MFFQLVSLVCLLGCSVWAQSQYTDDADWNFDNRFQKEDNNHARDNSYHSCRVGFCTGVLGFFGSSIQIYGVQDGRSQQGQTCRIDFSWPNGNFTYTYPAITPESPDPTFQVSFLNASGFHLTEKSYVSFNISDTCQTGLDYAVLTFNVTSIAQTSSTTSTTSAATSPITIKDQPRVVIGIILGGVIGGSIIIMILSGSAIWTLIRRRKFKTARETPKSSPAETDTLLANVASPPSNSLAITAQSKQIPVNGSTTAHIPSLSTSELRPISPILPVPTTEQGLLSLSDPEHRPAVETRLEQLEAAIHRLQRQGTRPPPY